MKDNDLERRQLLKLLISLPIGLSVGCDLDRVRSLVRTAELSPEESLRQLILLLGPWADVDQRVGEDFASRFLAAEHAIAPYLPSSGALVQKLATRFQGEVLPLKQVDLKNLPEAERELLLMLVQQLYSLIEIRFLVSGEPPWGECQTDTLRHTRAPT